MLLSFIVPIYNVEQYIDKCLSSICKQITRNDIEIIIVNDGTKDKSMKIVAEFQKSNAYIKIINQQNQGLSVARNSGLNESAGKYVWFFDSDDWLLDNSLEIIIHELESNPGVDLISTPLKWCYPTGDSFIDFQATNKKIINCEYYFKEKYSVAAIPRYIIKKSIILDNNLSFYPGLLHEDNLFGNVLLYYSKAIRVMKDPVYAYRQREIGSIMHSVTIKSAYDLITIHKELIYFMNTKVALSDRIWYRRGLLHVLDGVYTFCKHLYNTPEFVAFEKLNRSYIKEECMRCKNLDNFKFKIHCYLLAYAPKFMVTYIFK